MTIEIVDFPIKNGGSFHSYVSLPEGTQKKHIPIQTPWAPAPATPTVASAQRKLRKLMGLGDLARRVTWVWLWVQTHLVGGFNHLEKYEFVNGKDYPIYLWKI